MEGCFWRRPKRTIERAVRRGRAWAIFALAVVVSVIVLPAPAASQSGNPNAAFDKAMAEVTKTQTNSAAEATAMEKAIAAARALKPAPAVPDATIAFEGRAEAAAKAAKDKSGFKAAADEFGKAVRIAPWVPAYHFNRGVLLEKAEDYAAAKRSLELYLKASPDAPDAREVKKKIAGLDYLASRPKTAPPAAAAAVSPKPAAPAGPRIAANSLAGLWKIEWSTGRDRDGNFWRDVFELQPVGGNRVTLRFVRSEGGGGVSFYSEISLTLNGLRAEGDRTWRNGNAPEHMSGAVSADGRSIFVKSTRDPKRTMLFVRYP